MISFVRFSFLYACAICFKRVQAVLKILDVVYVARTYFVRIRVLLTLCETVGDLETF